MKHSQNEQAPVDLMVEKTTQPAIFSADIPSFEGEPQSSGPIRPDCLRPIPDFQSQMLLRLPQVLQIIPVAPSTWWEGIKAGRYPAGYKLSPRVTVWKAQAIAALIDGLGGEK